MFQAEEFSETDAQVAPPVDPLQASERWEDDSPDKRQPPPCPPPIHVRINAVLRANVAALTGAAGEDDVRPQVAMFDSSFSPRGPGRRESEAIHAELVDDVVPLEVTHVGETREQSGRKLLPCTLVGLGCSLIVATAVFGVIFFVAIPSIRKGPGDAAQPSPAPTQFPTNPSTWTQSLAPTTKAPIVNSKETVWTRLIQSHSPFTTFEDAVSPQRLALDWMLQDPFSVSLDDDNRLVQRFAMAVVYFATGGPATWKHDAGWLDSTDECKWYGLEYDVGCSQNSVEEVLLWGDGLSGSVPKEIGLLTNLKRLTLFSNEISGSIPTEVGVMTALLHLSLSNNNFEGYVPSEFGLLTSLLQLSLFDNKLQGTIPSELGLATSLTTLSLYGNNFQGSIPTEIGLLTSLVTLTLWDNDFSGVSIPTEVGRLTALTSLGFSGNSFHGSIPTEIGLLTMLSFRLSFHGNPNLSGKIPSELGNLINLFGLYLYDTDMSGSIPTSLCSTLTQAQINCGEIECDCCTSSAGTPC